MIDFGSKCYYNEKLIKNIESIGYHQRIGNYYGIAESDGYINISYYMVTENNEIIQFHKNFYSDYINRTKKDLHFDFYNFSDFVKFISDYHKKEFRKLKLNKLNQL